MRAFVRDFLATFIAVAIPMLLAGWIINLLPWPKFELATFLPALMPLHLVYLVPIGLLVFGARTRNTGVLAGVFAGGFGLYLWLAYSLSLQQSIIRDLEAAATTTPAPDASPRMLILANKRDCDSLCVQILATSDYQVAIPYRSAWWIYRRAEGDDCEQESALLTCLMFLTRGYLGLCAAVATDEPMPDGIAIAEYKLAGKGDRTDDIQKIREGSNVIIEHPAENETAPIKQIAERVPAFVGRVYERSIRIAGRDQLVERQFDGELFSPAELLTLSLAPGPIRLGDDSTRAEFYGRALGLQLSKAERPGPENLDMLFDTLERELMAARPDVEVMEDRPIYDVANAFGLLSKHTTSAEAPLVRARTERFLRSDRAALIDAGLFAIAVAKTHDLPEMETTVARLLESNNPAIVANTLRKAVFFFEIVDRPEIRKRISEIPFRAELLAKGSPLVPQTPSSPQLLGSQRIQHTSALLIRQLVGDGTYRQRVADYLRSATYVIPGHCETLLSIIARGDDEASAKRETLDALLATRSAVFSACAMVLQRGHRRDLFPASNLSESQVGALRDRADLVPPSALRNYWRQFLSAEEARSISDEHMIRLVQRRLSLAREFHYLPERDLAEIEQLLKDLKRD